MKLLIVSFRNTCRGPMAGGLARRIAAQQGLALEVETAGMTSTSKGSVAPLAVEAMSSLGVDISRHQSKPVTPQVLESADVVVAVEPDLAVGLRLQYPDTAEKVLELGGDVPDPHRPGATLADYVACRDLLETLLRQLPIYTPYGRGQRGGTVGVPPFGRGSRSQGILSCRSGVS